MFMYDFYTAKLPNAFKDLLKKVSNIHAYNARLAARQTYYLPSVRTKYYKLNLRFIGAKIWNTVSADKNECQNIISRKQLSPTSKLLLMLF